MKTSAPTNPQVLLQAAAMKNKRRAHGSRPDSPAIAGWLLVLTFPWNLGVAQVCQDFSVDTGVYW